MSGNTVDGEDGHAFLEDEDGRGIVEEAEAGASKRSGSRSRGSSPKPPWVASDGVVDPVPQPHGAPPFDGSARARRTPRLRLTRDPPR